MEVIKAAEILIEKIKKDYRNDVACVVIMGSYIYGDTHSRSDLDLYFIPKTERGFQLGKVFVIGGIGFDYWPISWGRLERIANHEERITSILTEGKVLYWSSEEDLARFERIREQALDTSDGRRFLHKAQEQVDEAKRNYFNLVHAETLAEVRSHAMAIIFALTHGIALLNRSSIKRGRRKLKEEILGMQLVPKDFANLYDTVFFSNVPMEIKEAFGQLTRNTEELVVRERMTEKYSLIEKMTGYYEELINSYNKIEHAFEIGDSYTPLFAAVELTRELEGAFSGTGFSVSSLPDLIAAYNSKLTGEFLETVKEHRNALYQLLKDNGVEITEYRDFEELRKYMEDI